MNSSESLEYLQQKKILIAGGTGFIGSHLVSKLVLLKSHIIVVSRHRPKIYSKNVKYITADLTSTECVNKLSREKFDIVVNLTGESNRINTEKVPTVNTFAVTNILLTLIKKNLLIKFVHLGSRLEYGRAKYLPVNEKHPTLPKDVYSIEKLLSSSLINRFCTYFNIPFTIIRASNTYGPHNKFKFNNHNLINYYIDAAVKKQKLTVFGSGRQKRDFIFIDDLISAIVLVLISNKSNGQIYNVGYGKPISFYSFVKLIADEANVKVKLRKWPKEYLAIETGDYYADISKIMNSLGWQPAVSFREGIKMSLRQL